MIEFPNAIYKNNTVNAEFSIFNESTNENYIFQEGDKIKVGIKSFINNDEYIIYKEIIPQIGSNLIEIYFSPKETSEITEKKAILEIMLEYNNSIDKKTVYQKEIELKEVVLNE